MEFLCSQNQYLKSAEGTIFGFSPKKFILFKNSKQDALFFLNIFCREDDFRGRCKEEGGGGGGGAKRISEGENFLDGRLLR